MAGMIQDGDWTPGYRLPIASDLMIRFDGSRGTIRSALDRLYGRGLIYKSGSSWYVERRVETTRD
jgi:DNA-binding GntR family transcriptional regulator